ncbi:BspA family leucine-rich repeat surface protein [Metamycoplasma auris]|nr:BspA family leucine-rich repeat surface protein [Metamycoplasma auris]
MGNKKTNTKITNNNKKQKDENRKKKRKYLLGIAALLLGSGLIAGTAVALSRNKKRIVRKDDKNKRTIIDLENAINAKTRMLPILYTEDKDKIIKQINIKINKQKFYKKLINLTLNDIDIVFSKETNSIQVIAKENQDKYKGKIELKFARINADQIFNSKNKFLGRFDEIDKNEIIDRIIKLNKDGLKDIDFNKHFEISIINDTVTIKAKESSNFYKGQITGYKFKLRSKVSDLIDTKEIDNYEFDLKPDHKKIIDLIKDKNPSLKDFDFEDNFIIEITDNKVVIVPISNDYKDKLEFDFRVKPEPEKNQDEVYDEDDKTELKEIGYFKNDYGQWQIKPIPATVKKVPSKLPGFITNLKGAFKGNINSHIEGLDKWDTSNVTNMIDMFKDAANFNQSLANFDTSRVVDMGRMFSGASSFNQDISHFKTSRVQNMGELFKDAHSFNQDIRSWDTSRVSDMNKMFMNAKEFNQDLSEWNVKKVIFAKDFNTNAHPMFANKKIPKKLISYI